MDDFFDVVKYITIAAIIGLIVMKKDARNGVVTFINTISKTITDVLNLG